MRGRERLASSLGAAKADTARESADNRRTLSSASVRRRGLAQPPLELLRGVLHSADVRDVRPQTFPDRAVCVLDRALRHVGHSRAPSDPTGNARQALRRSNVPTKRTRETVRQRHNLYDKVDEHHTRRASGGNEIQHLSMRASSDARRAPPTMRCCTQCTAPFRKLAKQPSRLGNGRRLIMLPLPNEEVEAALRHVSKVGIRRHHHGRLAATHRRNRRSCAATSDNEGPHFDPLR